MPTLRIEIRDEVWVAVAAALSVGYEPPPDGKLTREWVERIAAGLFADRVAELMDPPPQRASRPSRRIRPSRVHSY